MITYTIHYARGESPQERMKAMLTAGSMDEPGELVRMSNERHVRILTNILENTVKSLNSLLQDVPNMSKTKFLYYQGKTVFFDSVNELLNLIIPQLEDLDKIIRPTQKINQEVITALKKVKHSESINPASVMKILVQFDVAGIKQIEFKNDNEEINLERLLDIHYPLDQVPSDYNCSVLMTVMSDPCKATLTEAVDRMVVKNTTSNPFTREPWPQSVPTDTVLSAEIDLFMKKTEWLYCAFNNNERYKHLYHDETIQGWLQDKDKSYEDFCFHADSYVANMTNSTNFVFFTAEKEANIFPPKYILDLFSKHQVHTLRPSKEEYEKLVRRMVGAGDHRGLVQLLSSPVLDVIKMDVYAKNEKGQNTIDLINSYQNKYPGLRERYSLCQQTLLNYKEPPPTDATLGCTIS